MGVVLPFRKPLEKQLEKWFRARVEKAGYALLKLSTPGRRGYPDRILLAKEQEPNTGKSTVMFIEFKREGQVLRKLQELRVAELRRRGYQVAVLSTKDEAGALLTMLGVTI